MCYRQANYPAEMHHRGRSHSHPFKQFNKQRGASGSTPPANVEEFDDKYTLTLYAPAFEKGDFEIRIVDDTLVIQGKPKTQEDQDEFRWRRREFIPRSFERFFQLNEKIDKNSISAKYEEGILVIELPKLEASDSFKQQINIE